MTTHSAGQCPAHPVRPAKRHFNLRPSRYPKIPPSSLMSPAIGKRVLFLKRARLGSLMPGGCRMVGSSVDGDKSNIGGCGSGGGIDGIVEVIIIDGIGRADCCAKYGDVTIGTQSHGWSRHCFLWANTSSLSSENNLRQSCCFVVVVAVVGA